MRVLHVSRTARRVGGVESHLLSLVSEQNANGATAQILHADDAAVNARAAVAAFAPDVLHVHGRFLPDDVERELQRDYPVVRSLHDYSFGCASGERWFRNGAVCTRTHGAGCIAGMTLGGCAHRLDLRPPLRRLRPVGRELELVRGARSVVAYSEYVRNIAVRSGVRDAICHTIPYFTTRAEHPAAAPATRTVAFAGRIVANKGLDVLLSALATIADAWDELLVAGDGWDRARCERLARDLRIANRARFLGWVDADAMRTVLEAASVVVLPSRWPEPFGIVGIEAMAAGRPVIASATGGIPEWLDDGATGILVTPGDAAALADALRGLLGEPERAAALGHEGWRRAERYSPETHRAALQALYEAVA